MKMQLMLFYCIFLLFMVNHIANSLINEDHVKCLGDPVNGRFVWDRGSRVEREARADEQDLLWQNRMLINGIYCRNCNYNCKRATLFTGING